MDERFGAAGRSSTSGARGRFVMPLVAGPSMRAAGANHSSVRNTHAENVRCRAASDARRGEGRRLVRDVGVQAVGGARGRARLLPRRHVARHAGARRPLEGGVDRRRRHGGRPDADADGHLHVRRRGGAVRAGRAGGRRRRRAGDGLRQSRLHAAERRLHRALFLHQGRAALQGRHRQGVVGDARRARARNLLRPR